MRKRARCCAFGFAVFMMAEALPGQAPVANVFDVGTIADLVRTSYQVISGPAGTPRQWRRDSTLYSPAATIVAMSERDGKAVTKTMTPDEYRRLNNDDFVKNGFFGREIGSRIERYGNVATVRSVSEWRRIGNGPLDGRSVNYFSLYWNGGRWWISGIVRDEERPSNPIPKTWIGVQEEVLFPTPVVRTYSTADSVAVVKPLAASVLKRLAWALKPGSTIFVGDRVTHGALDSAARVEGFLLQLPPQVGMRTGIGCPFKMSADSAELNERAAVKGFGVGFRIFSLDDSTAIVGFGAGCGTGVAPFSAYSTGGKFRLRRVVRGPRFQLKQVTYEWVIDSVIDSWVT